MNLLKKILPIGLALFGMVGCSSQGKVTHAVFERQDASFRELDLSLKELYLNIYNGSTDDQFKAVYSLRHLAKWMDDPGKRAMAAKGLVFTAAFSDDGDVVDSADSRAESLVRGDDLYAASAVIDAKVGIVTGHFGLLKKDTSVFSSEVTEEFILADDSERENALDFLTSNFDEVDEGLQLKLAFGFADILNNPANCYKTGYKMVTKNVSETVPNPLYVEPKEGEEPTAGVPKMITKNKILTMEDKTQPACKKDDLSDQASWKKSLIEDINDMLSYGGITPEVSSALLLAAAGTTGLEDKMFVANEMSDWIDDGVIAPERQGILEAAINRAKGYYPDLYKNKIDLQASAPVKEETTVDETKSAMEIAKQLEASKSGTSDQLSKQLANAQFQVRPNFANPGAYLGLAFWMNNSDMVLQRQLFRPSSRYQSGPVPGNQAGFVVPLSWLNYRGFDGTPESNELKIVLYRSLINRLDQGYTFDSSKGLVKVALKSIQEVSEAKPWEIDLQMDLIRAAWPSLVAGGADYKAFEEAILAGVERHQEEPQLISAYISALVGVLAVKNQEEAVCEVLKTKDVKIQLAAFDQVKTYDAYKKPQATDSVLPSPTFCGVSIYEDTVKKAEPEMDAPTAVEATEPAPVDEKQAEEPAAGTVETANETP